MAKKRKKDSARRLFRVMLRGQEYLGTAEQWHAKVVAPDFLSALQLALEALELDPVRLDGSAVTLIAEDTELRDGKVFDVARRSRGFGERGGWTFRDVLPEKRPTGPRSTEVL